MESIPTNPKELYEKITGKRYYDFLADEAFQDYAEWLEKELEKFLKKEGGLLP